MAENYSYNYNYNGGNQNRGNGPGGPRRPTGSGGNDDLWSWIVVVGALVIFWPVGLVLLLKKLLGGSGTSAGFTSSFKGNAAGRHPYDVAHDTTPGAAGDYYAPQQGQNQRGNRQQPGQGANQNQWGNQKQWGNQRQQGQTPPRPSAAQPQQPKISRGDGLTVTGAVLAGIGALGLAGSAGDFLAAGFWSTLAGAFPLVGFLGVGLALLAAGTLQRKKAKRFHKYLALIGKRDGIAISTLAQAMPVNYKTACNDLQDMLDDGILQAGYLDMQRGRLVLSPDGIVDEEPEPAKKEEPPKEEVQDENDYLIAIKTVNDAIPDQEMSRKIDRIGEITSKILDYQRKNPGKAGQLRSFLNYYLPTTLKILRAYAQLEAQGIEGENITAAKVRIEGMMDKVVEGFEKQLDKLFQGDALDITTDVAVLEKMLDNDGLSNTGGITMTL